MVSMSVKADLPTRPDIQGAPFFGKLVISLIPKRCVAHIEEEKKELVRDVHRLARLGVQLVDSTKGGVMVHNGSESSFVADVKTKQGLDPIFV
ncbi:hypothetical protein MTR67_038870 [Solanum verrucosum]|uniref:Uncharacterized protein n=1 Tax=Solanum verrucosum TaxID=315347 RepID=A0AAF0ZQ39_SOLVR|nr:hypothetical protein MTR67_038870 [Solanum verrucosum]